MKRIFFYFSILALIIILSFGIVDGLLALSSDINNHLWLNLVGRWESRQTGYYEIEFKQDGTFNEYYYGVKKGFGEFEAYGNSIVLNYDPSICLRGTGNRCTVYMKLYFEIKSLILKDNESKMSFKKVVSRK
jgi:hypothetical protein